MKTIIIWNPAYEASMSREASIQALRSGWARVPEMNARRQTELRQIDDVTIVNQFLDEIEKDWGKRLNLKKISVIVIHDPVWTDERRYRETVVALTGGYASVQGPRRQFIVLPIDLERALKRRKGK